MSDRPLAPPGSCWRSGIVASHPAGGRRGGGAAPGDGTQRPVDVRVLLATMPLVPGPEPVHASSARSDGVRRLTGEISPGTPIRG
jgi:hypothetical protein